ncbi:MAG: hypothetical protein PF487_04390 [Bacteroidales bacterium]|jgi:hypothetical protein|nr:hypothetical protein [Bacteroidales bacterium]
MRDITKEKLILLGFDEEYSTPEESGTENGYYYYTYNINDNCLLISDASDENDGNFTIEFFEIETIKITSKEDLLELINLIKKNKVK